MSAVSTDPIAPVGGPIAPVSDKSWTTAMLLCFFVGFLGVHRFYVGRVGGGIAQLLTLGGLGIWATVDMVFILLSRFEDASGRVLQA